MSGERTAAFIVLIDCPRCGQPLPLDAPLERASCAACGGEVSVPFALWHDVLLAYEARCHLLQQGADFVERLQRGAFDLRVTLRPMWPACARCGAALATPEIGASGPVPCGACGATHWSWPAPPELRQLLPATAQIVSTSPGPLGDSMAAGLAQLRAPEGADLLALQCPTCGTQVRVEPDGARVIGCSYCRAQLFVPDALYRRLYGGRAPRPFYVTFTGPTMDEAEQRRREAIQAAEEAERRARAERARRAAIEAENHELARQQAQAYESEAEALVDREIAPLIERTRSTGMLLLLSTLLAILAEVAAGASEKRPIAWMALALAVLGAVLAIVGRGAMANMVARRLEGAGMTTRNDPRRSQVWWMGGLTLGLTALLAILYPAEWNVWPTLACAVFLGGMFGVMNSVMESVEGDLLKPIDRDVGHFDGTPYPSREAQAIQRIGLGWSLIGGVLVVAIQLLVKPAPATTDAAKNATGATDATSAATTGTTATPGPTAAATATMARPTLPPATTFPKTLLSEDFADSRRAWPYRDADVIFAFDDGGLLASVRREREGWVFVPLDHDDVTIDVDVEIQKEDSDAWYGVVCRRTREKGFYSVEIASDGTAFAFKHPTSTFASRLGSSKAQGSVRSKRHLHVECIGDALRAYVDGQPALEVHDATYAKGDWIGVIAGKSCKSAEPAIARFDDLVVRGR
jgi:hypothetical protein